MARRVLPPPGGEGRLARSASGVGGEGIERGVNRAQAGAAAGIWARRSLLILPLRLTRDGSGFGREFHAGAPHPARGCAPRRPSPQGGGEP
jgi:hypothetical protein